jgi:tRNA A-37 threonylcarbamoyl transferase component Bud32
MTMSSPTARYSTGKEYLSMNESTESSKSADARERQVRNARFADMIKTANPKAYEFFNRLQEEFRSMALIEKLLALPYYSLIWLLAGYFGEGDELKIAVSLTEDRSGPNASPEITSGKRIREFLRAATQINILYTILPAMFVLLLTSLNKLAPFCLRTPMCKSMWSEQFDRLSSRFKDPRWLRDFTLDFRPLILTWFCLVPPIAITMMLFVAIKTFISYIRPQKVSDGVEQRFGHPCLVFRQHIDKTHQQRNFYSSGWFNPIILTPFLIGVPAAISLWIYFNLGVDGLLGYPSHDPRFHTGFVVISLYLSSLAACLSALFFRSYFSFAWNFDSPEYALEVYPDMIKQLPVEGWFHDFLSLSARSVPNQILWEHVKSIEFHSDRYKPRSSAAMNPVVAFFGKITTVFESVAQKMDIVPDYLEIGSSFGTNISIRLWELSQKQKLELYRAIRTHCPAVYLSEDVQHALVGSAVMREPQYTEIWFAVLSDGSTLATEGDLQPKSSLGGGKYTVVSKIASGGQAVVYEATNAAGTSVVLKEFRLTNSESLDAKIESARDFENESAIVSQLSHDSIVKMLDMFYDGGRVYIVLEQVEGKSLREFVSESGPVDTTRILDLAEQMCEMLIYLHSLEPSVVHRDFTPDNIILQPNGQLKLIDFSVAQRKEKKNSASCAGKHSYTPPEQFAGEACSQSDIYALGATLYYLFTGEDPEPITNSRLSAPHSHNEKRLDDLIKGCTQLDLCNRYESATWVLNELRHQQESSPEGEHRITVSAPRSNHAPGEESEETLLETVLPHNCY